MSSSRDMALLADRVVPADGQGRVMLELAKTAAASGHRVTVYARAADPSLAEHGIRYVPIAPGRGPQLAQDVVFARTASRLLSRSGHDIACIKGPCAAPPTPYVYYASFSWDAWRTAMRAVPGVPARQRAHAAASARRERSRLRGASAVLAVSESLADDLRRTAGGSLPPVHVVPNGIEPREFAGAPHARATARRRFGIGETEYVIAFVGEYTTPRKGLRGLVRAVAPGEQLIVAGAGPSGARPEKPGVHYAGVVDPITPVYAAADLVVVPSLYEPFSLVATEAAAAGVPVAVSARAGAAGYLKSAAFLIDDPADHRSIRAAIDAARRDPAATRARAERARQITETMTWDQTSAQAVRVLEEAAGRRDAARERR